MNRLRSCGWGFLGIALFTGISVVAASGTATSPVEELAGKLPDTTLSIAATSGADSLRPAFKKSSLGKLWYDPALQQFYQQLKGAVKAKINLGLDDPEATEAINRIIHLAKLVLARPILISTFQKQVMWGSGHEFPFDIFLIMWADEKKTEIAQAIEKVEALAGQGEFAEKQIGSYLMHGLPDDRNIPLWWGWVENYFVIGLSNDTKGRVIQCLQGQDQAKRGKLIQSLSRINGNGDVLTMHFDIENIIRAIESDIFQQDDRDGFQQALQKLGIHEVRSFTGRMGFSGKHLINETLLEAPQPFSGLLSCFKPVDLARLDWVDERAATAGTINIDLGGIFDSIMGMLAIVAPGYDYQKIIDDIAEFETDSNCKIRQGLFKSWSGPVVWYSLPAGALLTAPTGGFVIIAELKDAPLFQQSLTAFGQYAANQSEGALRTSTQEQDGKQIHFWTVPPLAVLSIMPCWTIVEDKLILASNFPLLNTALNQITSQEAPKKSLRTTPDFQNTAKNLPNNLIFLNYINSRTVLAQGMIEAQKYWPMVTMFAGQMGVHLTPMLPNLTTVIETLDPIITYSWISDQGIRLHRQGPGVLMGLTGVGVTAIGASVLMPALADARERARQIQCASQLNIIGKAINKYQNEHQSKNPATLEVLIKKADLDPEMLICPSNGADKCRNSYIYRGADLNTSVPESMILVYDKLYNHDRGLRNVLFADMHVTKMNEHKFQEAIQKDNELRRQKGLTEKPLK